RPEFALKPRPEPEPDFSLDLPNLTQGKDKQWPIYG
ncbi:unnamed protein product, partial [marine sediment metagenome]